MHLLRCLFFIEARFEFELTAVHIHGAANTLADKLSRNDLPAFLSLVQHMDSEPTPVEPRLLSLLLETGDWTSQAWTASFSSICTTA